MRHRKSTILAALCFALMIPGCDKAAPPAVEVRETVVAEAVQAACPDVAVQDRAEARSTLPRRPHADVTDGNGRPAASAQSTQSLIDAHAVAVTRKNKVIVRLIDQIDACRAPPDVQPTPPTPAKQAVARAQS